MTIIGKIAAKHSKLHLAILLFTLLFSLPVYSVICMEYSQAMVDAFTDSKNQSFIKNLTWGEPITLARFTKTFNDFGDECFRKRLLS